MSLGLYISIPFCRAKCSYCNFASGVFPPELQQLYVQRLGLEISAARGRVQQMGCELDNQVDSVYFGGGTPTLLTPGQLDSVFGALQEHFQWKKDAEVTVECAPGSLSGKILEALLRNGVNRISLGVQSFVEDEARTVGRLHNHAMVQEDISRLCAAGIDNLNVDLIAGLPHQTADSWRFSLEQTIACGALHASVYMLEVDEESRLGRELIAGGTRYHAHFVPGEDRTADLYNQACETLQGAGIAQYEISNFARPGSESRHNLKYWTRQPYLGFGVDAHSFLQGQQSPGAGTPTSVVNGVRFSNSDSLDGYLAGDFGTVVPVSPREAFEEEIFLGLRLNRGLELRNLTAANGLATALYRVIEELCGLDLLMYDSGAGLIRLTPTGRLLSNDVFVRFLQLTPRSSEGQKPASW